LPPKPLALAATSKDLSEQDKAMNIALARLDCLKAQAGGK